MRRVTLASLIGVVSGSIVLESWRLAIAGGCFVLLGWIGARGLDAWRAARPQE